MKAKERILVAIDGSEASDKAVSYLARVLAGTSNADVHLFHIVEPIPPYYRQMHGDLGEKVTDIPSEAGVKLIEEAKTRSEPVITRMKGILTRHEIPEECIKSSWFVAAREDSLVGEVLDTAKELGQSTIVVGRTSLPWYRELFHSHLGDRLVKKAEGLAVWIVE